MPKAKEVVASHQDKKLITFMKEHVNYLLV